MLLVFSPACTKTLKEHPMGENEKTSRIIVLDSNDELLEAMCKLLERKGHEVHRTSSLVELFDALENETFDILVMEHLPARNWDLKVVADYIRQERIRNCVLTSSFVMEDYSESVSALDGTVRWLKRPFKIGSLLAHIESMNGEGGA